MKSHADLMQHIVELETSLHLPVLRRDAQILEQLLHSEFAEISRSGQLYNRDDIVVALLSETEQMKIESENFTLSKMSEDGVILTYQSFELTEDNLKVRRTLRSSIWLRSERDGWQLRFHQGTPMKE